MQTSGLLIHLSPQASDGAISEELGAQEGLVLGERDGRLWPAVLEAPTSRASIDAVRSLERLQGIGKVDVVFVGTDDREGEQA